MSLIPRSEMDEAEKYQQRLQAIAEKRRLQEEQEQARRQMEDERLRLQQLKRKSLRDQWLMEGPPISPDHTSPRSPLWGSQANEIEERIDKLQEETHRLASEEEKINVPQEEDGHTYNDTDKSQHQDAPGAERKDAAPKLGPTPAPRVRKGPLENGPTERAVIEAVEVTVEKDLKTGATSITSVAAVNPAHVAHPGEVVFDDGHKSVHAISGMEAAQPTTQELGLILDAVAQSVPVEARVVINGKTQDVAEVAKSFTRENGLSQDAEEHSGTREIQLQNETTVNGHIDPEGFVTMTFLGFTEAEPGQALHGEDFGEVMRAERVVITDDGEVKDPSTNHEALNSEEDTESGVDSEECTVQKINTEEGETEVSGPEAEENAEEKEADKNVEQHEEQDNVTEKLVTDDCDPSEAVTTVAQEIINAVTAPTLSSKVEADVTEVGTSAPGVQSVQFHEVPLTNNTRLEEAAGQAEHQPLVTMETGTKQQEIPAQPVEQEPLMAASTRAENTSVPSHAKGEGAPKHKTCQCCTIM